MTHDSKHAIPAVRDAVAGARRSPLALVALMALAGCVGGGRDVDTEATGLAGDACSAPTECATERACLDGRCRELCIDNGGCSTAGQRCRSGYCVPVPEACGDDVLGFPDEQCDDGAANADIADACRTDCTLPACGDAITDSGEQCDGGAANSDVDADACRTDCALARCGDSVVDTGELCDQGADNSDTTANACRSSCTLARCGDGAVDSGEACDQGAGNSDTTPNACRTGCTLARCGDGIIDSGEGCDQGASNSNILADHCRTDCTLARCGDGIIDSGEDCEDQNANTNDGCDLCLLATQHITGTVPTSLDAGSRTSDGQLTLLYLSSNVNGETLLAQTVPAVGSNAASPVSVSNLDTTSGSGAHLVYPRLAQNGDDVAVAYSYSYTSSIIDTYTVSYAVQRAYIATSIDAGQSWTRDVRMDPQVLATSLPTNANCPAGSFFGATDTASSAVGYLDGSLAVLTRYGRSFSTNFKTCSVPPTISNLLSSSLSADNGASFSPDRVNVPVTALSSAVYTWAPATSGKSVVGFVGVAAQATTYGGMALQTTNSGVSWTEQHVFSVTASSDVYESRKFDSPASGTLMFYDRNGWDYSLYAYASPGANWTTPQTVPTTGMTYKRLTLTDGSGNVTMLWEADDGTSTSLDLRRALSTNGGATYGASELLLSTPYASVVSLADAQMSETGEITALVCTGTAVKPAFEWINYLASARLLAEQSIPCANPARLGMLRWQDGTLPSTANIEYVTDSTDLTRARLVRDSPTQTSAVWGVSAAGSEGVYVRRLR